MDDRQAIARLKHGDIDGLALLVSRYQVRAVRTAFLITGDPALAEDVVQAAFLRIYRRIDQFDSSRPFAPWLMKIVVNAAVQAAQKQVRQVSLDDETAVSFADILADPAPGLEARMEAAEQEQMIRDALEQLPPEQRAAIVLRYYLDYSEAEMSEMMASPPGTVKWRLHTARRQLKVLLRRFAQASGWSEV